MPVPSPSGSNAAVRVLGADPWMRFDLWATRAWESAEAAAALAAANGAPVNPDDDLDHRIVTLFHSAAVAKGFAEMVNPLIAVTDIGCDDDSHTAKRTNIVPDMAADIED